MSVSNILTGGSGWVDMVRPVSLDPLNTGLVARYQCLPGITGGSRFVNLVAPGDKDGAHGTLTNGPTWEGPKGRSGGFGSIDFDGSNDIVTVPYHASLDAPDGLTIALWIYDKNISGNIHAVNRDGGTRIFIIRPQSSTVGNYHIWNSSDVLRQFTPSSSWMMNQWFHLIFAVGVAGGNLNLEVFINGVSVGTDSFSGTAIKTGSIGANFGGDGGGSYLACYLDDIRYYNRVFPASEALALYRDSLQGSPRTLKWVRWPQRDYTAAGGAGNRRRRLIFTGAL